MSFGLNKYSGLTPLRLSLWIFVMLAGRLNIFAEAGLPPITTRLPDGHYIIRRTSFLPTEFPQGTFKTINEAMAFAEKVRNGSIKLSPVEELFDLYLHNEDSSLRAVYRTKSGEFASSTNIFVGIAKGLCWSFSEYSDVLLFVSNHVDAIVGSSACASIARGRDFIKEISSLGLYAIDWSSLTFSGNAFDGKARNGKSVHGIFGKSPDGIIDEFVVQHRNEQPTYDERFQMFFNNNAIPERVLISSSDDEGKSWHMTYEYTVIEADHNISGFHADSFFVRYMGPETQLTVYDLQSEQLLFHLSDGRYAPVMKSSFTNATRNGHEVTRIVVWLFFGGTLIIPTYLFLRAINRKTNNKQNIK